MYKDEHVTAWTRIVRFVHDGTPAKIGLQLGHAGPKGSTQLGWEEPDEPLADRGKARQNRPKPKRQRAVCSVCGGAEGGLYRHTGLALYCAKHVPKNAP